MLEGGTLLGRRPLEGRSDSRDLLKSTKTHKPKRGELDEKISVWPFDPNVRVKICPRLQNIMATLTNEPFFAKLLTPVKTDRTSPTIRTTRTLLFHQREVLVCDELHLGHLGLTVGTRTSILRIMIWWRKRLRPLYRNLIDKGLV